MIDEQLLVRSPGTPQLQRSGGQRLGKALLSILSIVTVLVTGYVTYQEWPVPLPPPPERLEVIAHRGVHQDFPEEGLNDATCTAERIFPPPHGYIENTLPSIVAAYRFGATAVELDVQPTTDGQLAVFHDWTLECRTDGQGDTRAHAMTDLRRLDIGYGYTADGGRSHPLRGKGLGMIPSLREALAAYPEGRVMVDMKDGGTQETWRLLSDTLDSLPAERREKVTLWHDRKALRDCAAAYALRLGIGALPEPCRGPGMLIPGKYLDYVPGWPNRFLRNAHDAGARIYVLTDDVEQARELARLPIAGIVTDRIEVIGPALTKA